MPDKSIENAKPSRDPADDGSILGTLNQVMKKMMQGVDDCLPAQVIAFDRNSNRATVKPMIKVLATSGESIGRAQIASVPVFQVGAGGYMLNFNLKAGDLGWIKATDRDMSLYAQGCTEQAPNTERMHSFNDGVFFPQIMQGFVIDPEDAENAVWQSLDGSVRIALWPEKVKITAPELHVVTPIVNVEADTSVTITTTTATVITDTVTVDASTSATVTTPTATIEADTVTVDSPESTFTGNVTVNGDVQIDGKSNTDGKITSNTEVQVGLIQLTQHGHLDVTNTAPIAGDPIP